MIYPTRGIVLTHTKYAETSIICHILTEQFGKQSYIINQVRSKKNKGKSVFLQPLTLLDLEVYHRSKKEIQRIKDFQVSTPFANIPFDQVRRGITFFLAEVMSNAFREEEKNEDLFEFVFHSIQVLDSDVKGVHNFHLFFLIQLSRLLGFSPTLPEQAGAHYFDLKGGKYKIMIPDHDFYLPPIEAELLKSIQRLVLDRLDQLHISSSDRNLMIYRLLQYYQLHLHGFKTVKSFDVLKSIFH